MLLPHQASFLAYENHRIAAEGKRAVKAVESEAVNAVGVLSAELHKLRTRNTTNASNTMNTSSRTDYGAGGFPSDDLLGGCSWGVAEEAEMAAATDLGGGGDRDRYV